MVDPLRVRVAGPLVPFVPGFVAELGGLGYRSHAATHQLRLVAHLSRWLAGSGLDATGLSGVVVGEVLAARRAAGYTRLCSPRALAPLLAYLRGLGVAPPPGIAFAVTPIDELLERYRAYLTLERRLTADVARDYVSMVRPFVADREREDGLDLEGLTGADVSAFV